MKLSRSKRFRLCIYVFHVYLITGVVGFFYYPAEINNLAMFFGSTSAPVIGYLFAETMRPSGQSKNNKKPIPPQESTDTIK